MHDAADESLDAQGSRPHPGDAERSLQPVDRSPWARLLALDPDAIIDELCAGRPYDLVSACRAHVQDNAYFVEDGRVAARAIATVVGLAGSAPDSALARLDTLIEECTADILAEGPLGEDESDLVDDPSADDPPLVVRLSRRLGVGVASALRLIPTLNGFGFGDRHVVFHCLLEGLTAREYAEAFDDDPRVIAEMLAEVTRMAVAQDRR